MTITHGGSIESAISLNLRIDHFRGFESYFCIPYGDKTARNGVWKKGPGYELFRTIEEKLG